MDKLGFVDKQLSDIGIPYQFMQWTSPVVYPYFTGELTEEPVTTEDGLEQSTLLLTGFYRGEYFEALEEAKKKIKRHFHPGYGLRGWTDEGAIVVFYDGSFYLPTGEADLKKIQINLAIKEWKGY